MTTIRYEARRVLELGLPVAVTQVGLMMLGVVDTMMLGRFSTEALASSALGRVWIIGTLLSGMGLVLGIDPLVSQAHGAGRGRDATLALQRGLVIAGLFTIPIAISWFFTAEVLVGWFHQNPALAREAESYALAQIPGIPAWLAFIALRSYGQGRGLVRPAMWIALLANGMNAFGNWVLIFGHLGVPSLGVVGAGISTATTQVAMAIALALAVRAWGPHREAWTGFSRAALELKGLRVVLMQGAPVAVMLALEIWAFHVAGILWPGRLGTTELAASTILLNLASLSFMIPLGISMGAAARVGNLIGARDLHSAQRAAWASFALGAGSMSIFAVTFLLGLHVFPTFYTGDEQVLKLTASLLPIAAAFQIFDGTQVVGCGVLRGMGKPRPAAMFNLLGYYAIALPLAHWLAFSRGAGIVGIWWGLASGLFVVAIACVAWIAWRGPLHATALEIEQVERDASGA